MGHANRTYRDTLFRSYFRIPENFLDLAHAVTGETFDPKTARENTVESILFNRLRNDVSYLVGMMNFVFFEHQSTWNGNMPVRMLLYAAEVYKGAIPRDLIYREGTIAIPAPRFFGFYNGKKDMPEQVTARLSDAFPYGAKAGIELTVDIYNINYAKQGALLKKCRPAHDYSCFVAEVQKGEQSGLSKEQAIEKAMRDCIRADVMRDYLESHWEEVFAMVSLVWNEDDARESYIAQGRELGREEGLEEGREEGRAEGREEGRKFMVYNMLSKGIPIDLVCEVSGWSKDRVRKLQLAHREGKALPW